MKRLICRGFSLIEILVVLFIMGITFTFALISFGDFGQKRQIIVAAEQLSQYIQLVQQYAILETSTLRIQPPDTWTSIPSSPLFRHQYFPKGMVINGTMRPFVIGVDASGDMTPFRLTMGSTTEPTIVTLIGKRNGTVTLQRAKSP